MSQASVKHEIEDVSPLCARSKYTLCTRFLREQSRAVCRLKIPHTKTGVGVPFVTRHSLAAADPSLSICCYGEEAKAHNDGAATLQRPALDARPTARRRRGRRPHRCRT